MPNKGNVLARFASDLHRVFRIQRVGQPPGFVHVIVVGPRRCRRLMMFAKRMVETLRGGSAEKFRQRSYVRESWYPWRS